MGQLNVPEPALLPITSVTSVELSVMTTFPKASSTATMAWFGANGTPRGELLGDWVKTSWVAVPAFTVTDGLVAKFVSVPSEPDCDFAVNVALPAPVCAVAPGPLPLLSP